MIFRDAVAPTLHVDDIGVVDDRVTTFDEIRERRHSRSDFQKRQRDFLFRRGCFRLAKSSGWYTRCDTSHSRRSFCLRRSCFRLAESSARQARCDFRLGIRDFGQTRSEISHRSMLPGSLCSYPAGLTVCLAASGVYRRVHRVYRCEHRRVSMEPFATDFSLFPCQ